MAKHKTIYIDACVFVSLFTKDEKFHKINDFFKERLDVEFVTSDWTLTEIVKVLIKDKKVSSKKVAEYIQELKRAKRIGEAKFDFVHVSKKNKYDFDEFFYDVQKFQLQYKAHLSDAIHAVIMKNNLIKTILTTDANFNGKRGMIVLNPMQAEK